MMAEHMLTLDDEAGLATSIYRHPSGEYISWVKIGVAASEIGNAEALGDLIDILQATKEEMATLTQELPE